MFEHSPLLRWRRYNEQHSLQGAQCQQCKKIYYPRESICQCGAQTFDPVQLSGYGKILSFTTITIPPAAFEHMTPYCLGLIALEQGPHIIAQITDVEPMQLFIGMHVHAVFRKMYASGSKGIIHYGIKFVPFEKHEA